MRGTPSGRPSFLFHFASGHAATLRIGLRSCPRTWGFLLADRRWDIILRRLSVADRRLQLRKLRAE
jgi:hypothetical protein